MPFGSILKATTCGMIGARSHGGIRWDKWLPSGQLLAPNGNTAGPSRTIIGGTHGVEYSLRHEAFKCRPGTLPGDSNIRVAKLGSLDVPYRAIPTHRQLDSAAPMTLNYVVRVWRSAQS